MKNIFFKYIKRTFDLARLGAGKTSPNPMVGAVLVFQNKIIGEGYHQRYGKAHAEVNALASVSKKNLKHLKDATLYVSLEPCSIHGNTPPCTDLIIKNAIPNVVISNIDETPGVHGTSVPLLESKGVNVKTKVLAKQGEQISIHRNTFVQKKRPHIVLKYAQSADGFIGQHDAPIWISNPISKRLVHKWRSETDAILVGTNTALIDNPKLNNRLYFGNSPLRIVLDRTLRLPPTLNLFDDSQPTWVITESSPPKSMIQTQYFQLPFDENLLSQLMTQLYQNKKSSLIVEGGTTLLQSFISANLWDEIRIFKTKKHLVHGIKAPVLNVIPKKRYSILDDDLLIYKNQNL